jgi:hypothetical protein
MLDHEPWLAVSDWPTCGVPEIAGSTVFDGAAGLPTASVAFELVLELDPPTLELSALTTTRTVRPTSADVSLYIEDVAPLMSWQEFPLMSQRCHL